MTEAGGPTTQAGIRYQDQVAALYMGRMLDPRERARHDQPVEVRVEAPTDVDDFVVKFADGSRRFFQVKLSLEARGEAWTGLWPSIRRQIDNQFTADDRIEVVFGEPSQLASNLRAITERRTDSGSAEWEMRLTAEQGQIIKSVQKVLACGLEEAWQLFGRLDVSVFPADELERDRVPLWMPPSSAPPARLFRALTEMAGEGAVVRTRFDGPALYERLRLEAGIVITDPTNWGSAKYREAIALLATIEVPGTSFKQQPGAAYLWPQCLCYEQGRVSDFDDDLPGWRDLGGVAAVDLETFPSTDLKALVVVAGPGFGKTTLVQALARKLALSGLLPVTIPIPKLADSDLSIAEYLAERTNSEFDIHIDWLAAANTGSLVLMLDGLDEVSSDRRTLVLERLKVYRASHPGVPWLMTVRDAGALVPPDDATMVELASLTDEDLQRYVDFYRPGEPAVAAALLGRITARPDLANLVRIPIFLALMLVLRREGESLRRSDLLDFYLETLFRPEAFKVSQPDALDTSVLRRIAERAAFEALETDSIGVTVKQLERCVKATDASLRTDDVREALVRRGVLRSAGLVRLTFPFPIVQEYLASTELLEQHSDQLTARLSLIVRRPWAQAIQFALERHREPGGLIDEVLARPDDVFHTGLRLLGRCLSNGMTVTQEQWQSLGERLAGIWGTTSWQTSRLVDGLVVDVFSKPLHPAVRARLTERRLLHNGTGTILARLRDPVLSIEVLTDLLARNLEHFWNLGDFQAEVDRLGTPAFELYVSRALQTPESGEDVAAIGSLIRNMKSGCVDADVARGAIRDERLPLEVRLSAFCHSMRPLDDIVEDLIKRAICGVEQSPASAAARALSSPLVDVASAVRLLKPSFGRLPDSKGLLPLVIHAWGKDDLRGKLADLLANDDLPDEERRLVLLYAANEGDIAAFDSLLEDVAVMDAKFVCATLSMFGHFPDRQKVQRAVAEISSREWTAEERCLIAGSLATGLLYRMRMFGLNSGTLEPTQPHPGRTSVFKLLEDWLALDDYQPWSHLRLISNAVRIGSAGAINGLRQSLDNALATEQGEDSSDGSLAGQVLDILHAAGKGATLDELEGFAITGPYNLTSHAIGLIAKGGTALHAESLIRLYERLNGHHRSTALGALEPLAARLGLRVMKVGNKLVSTPVA